MPCLFCRFCQKLIASTLVLKVYEDNQAVLAIIAKGYSPKLKHLAKFHRYQRSEHLRSLLGGGHPHRVHQYKPSKGRCHEQGFTSVGLATCFWTCLASSLFQSHRFLFACGLLSQLSGLPVTSNLTCQLHLLQSFGSNLYSNCCN